MLDKNKLIDVKSAVSEDRYTNIEIPEGLLGSCNQQSIENLKKFNGRTETDKNYIPSFATDIRKTFEKHGFVPPTQKDYYDRS